MENAQDQLAISNKKVDELAQVDDWLERSGIQIRTMYVKRFFDLFYPNLMMCRNCSNVVGTLDLQTPVELKTIALHARNAEYNPKVIFSRK